MTAYSAYSTQWKPTLGLLVCIFFLSIPASLADSASSASETTVSSPTEPANTAQDDESIHWSKPLPDGPDRVFYFAEAISGKKLKPETCELLRGVTEVDIRADKIIFKRIDQEEMQFGRDTVHGSKFFQDWEKAKVNLEAKFGPSGKDFMDSIESVRISGDRIEVQRKGPAELSINLGERKLHHAFDLRGLRIRQMSMTVDTSAKHPQLKEIQGISAIINAPGFSFPVEVKEFAKLRLEKENDIKVGVQNPVLSAVRTLLFMQPILRFHFRLSRKD